MKRLLPILLAAMMAGCASPEADLDGPVSGEDATAASPPPEGGKANGLLLVPLVPEEYSFRLADEGHKSLAINFTASQPTQGQAAVLVYVHVAVEGPGGEQFAFRVGPTTSVNGPVTGGFQIPGPASGDWTFMVQIWPRGMPVEYELRWCAGAITETC